MKTLCKTSAIALALVTLHLSPFAFRLHAAVPTEWQVRIGPKATVYQAERYPLLTCLYIDLAPD